MAHRRDLMATTILGALCWVPQAASAQAPTQPPTSSEEARGGISDIIVTARRVEESLQTTPIAVTALGGAALERTQVVNIQDLQRAAPGLVVATGSPGTSGLAFVSIRGQGSLNPALSTDPAVAIYIDGVYVPRPSQGLFDIQDMQRVEVLRGPQGTLFGRNTTGGAINLISKDPVDRLEGSVRAELGNFNHREVGGVLNVPLGDNLAARAVYNFRDRERFGRNVALNRDVGGVKSQFIRAKIKYDAENFDVTFSGDYNKMTDNGQMNTLGGYRASMFASGALASYAPLLQSALHRKENWHTVYVGGIVSPTGPLNPSAARDTAIFAALPDEVRAMYNLRPYNRTTAYGGSATINAVLGGLNLKSITGFRYMDTEGLADTDGSPAPVLSTLGGSDSRQWSEELQMSGDLTNRLSFITGGYWSRETGVQYTRSQIFGGLLRHTLGDAENISKGLFAQAYYQITDTMRATGGLRYTWDTRITDLHNRQVFGLGGAAAVPTSISPTGFNCSNANVAAAPVADRAAVAADCSLLQSARFSYPAWTAGLDWQATPDIFVYAATRGAAKAGGWNMRAGALPSFRPEKVKDIEGGIKATWLNRRLRTNIAVFHTWKKDSQTVVSAFVPGAGVSTFTQNQGENRVWGAEFEATAVPWEGMEITFSASLQDGKYTKFQETQRIASATPLTGCVAAPATAGGVPQFDCTVDLTSQPITQLPKTQLNIGLTQRIPAGNGEFSIHADYAYISSQHFDPVKAADQQSTAVKAAYAEEARLSRIAGYGLFNARISYELNNPNLEFYLFGRNLTENKYLIRSFADLYATGQLGIAAEFPGNPRTFGIGVKWKYGG